MSRATLMRVPETTVDEDDDSPRGKHDVRLAWKPPVVEAKPQTGGPQGAAHPQFRDGIPPPYTRHNL